MTKHTLNVPDGMRIGGAIIRFLRWLAIKYPVFAMDIFKGQSYYALMANTFFISNEDWNAYWTEWLKEMEK